MKDLFSLQSKFIIVTGGTRGIGAAISSRFVRAGASVIANYVRDVKSAEALKYAIAEEGFTINLCRADLTSPTGMDRLINMIDESGQKVDGLVHCAATGVHRTLEELNLRYFDWTFALNVRAYFELVRRLIPNFAENASIVALSSAGAERAALTYSLIGASKGALESLSRHFILELAYKNIRVNTLSAGAVMTDAWKVLPDSEKRLTERIVRSPKSRLTTPDEVAWSAQYLCSDASSGVNGHTLVVDGGERIVE